jgi:cytochrome c oxidase subunit 2
MGSKLIAIVVIVLGVIAIAQLVRMYELSSKLGKKSESDFNSRDNNLNGKLLFGFMLFQFISFIYLMLRYGWTGRGESASVHGNDYDWLFNINLAVVITGFFITNFLLFWFASKYIKKPGVPAYYFSHNNKLELIWTIVPAIILATIIILGLRTWNDITDDADKDSVVIELFAKQFDWTARYSGNDNLLGKFDYKLTTDANELGLITAATIDSAIYNMENGVTGIKVMEGKLNDRNLMMIPDDRADMVTDLSRKQRLIRLLYQMREKHDTKLEVMAYDDIIQKDTLFLSVDQEYEFNFRAKDVIHSAFFPHFRAQMNAVPGLTTRFKLTPDITTAEMRIKMNNPKFSFILMCNKICGGAHYKMKMIVVVLPKNEYNKWIESKKADNFLSKFSATSAPEAPATSDTTLVVGN